jgi:hypothetical protein
MYFTYLYKTNGLKISVTYVCCIIALNWNACIPSKPIYHHNNAIIRISQINLTTNTIAIKLYVFLWTVYNILVLRSTRIFCSIFSILVSKCITTRLRSDAHLYKYTEVLYYMINNTNDVWKWYIHCCFDFKIL